MFKYHQSLIFLLILLSTSVRGQENFNLVKTIPSTARLISVDQLGNIYLVVKNNVHKYDRNGKLINQYSNQRYGEIKSIDATDPYKIVVFYESFRIIVILDNQLSQNGSPIDMQFSEFDQPVLACRAYNTGVWMFDQLLYKLYRLTLNLEIVQSTGNLTQILGYKLQPNYMMEYNNQLYVSNPETGILVFDQYGTYIKNIAITGLKSFQVTEKSIYYTDEQEIKRFHLKNLDTRSLTLPDNKIKGLALNKNRLFIITGTELKIYDYSE